jgi:hypothetical protein
MVVVMGNRCHLQGCARCCSQLLLYRHPILAMQSI